MEKKFSTFNFQLSTFQRGFTLIELLVVIAVLGVLAAGVLVAINPLQKIAQANDARAKNDLGQIVQALQSYYVTQQQYITGSSLTDLETKQELKKIPTPPTGYTYSYYSADGTKALLYTTLKAPKVAATPVYCWDDTLSAFKEIAAPVPASTPTACQ